MHDLAVQLQIKLVKQQPLSDGLHRGRPKKKSAQNREKLLPFP